MTFKGPSTRRDSSTNIAVRADHAACPHSPLTVFPRDGRGLPLLSPTCTQFVARVVRVDPDQTVTHLQYAPPSRTGQKGTMFVAEFGGNVPYGEKVWTLVRVPILDAAGKVAGFHTSHREGEEEAPAGYAVAERDADGVITRLEPTGPYLDLDGNPIEVPSTATPVKPAQGA